VLASPEEFRKPTLLIEKKFHISRCSQSFWLSSDVTPILLAHIVINLDGSAAAMQRVSAVALRARNPEVIACLHVIVIRLETQPLQTLKAPAAIINRATRLGEHDTTNARRPNHTATLILDIHDATFHAMRVNQG
jgi:hypothetical protein